ncbi:MAG: ABC transporter substrate-binding protein [Lachnospiraceae bacterium]|nr:ABC transporter substrate-binding protein [Lachnospiraceae bacterium]
MIKIRKAISGLLLFVMAGALTACGTKETSSSPDTKVSKIGVCQLVTHDALDASYQGFVDGLKDAGYVEGENITIDYQNAQGDASNCNTIATKLVNEDCDLILAIATNAAQSCANATKDIPILVTAVTDPAEAGVVETNEVPGGNVSGTSDLTPVKKQMELLVKLLPEAKKVAILYCSSETNSQIQADMAKTEAESLGLETQFATISSLNEVQQVVQSLVGKVDVIYTPTDNMIASGMDTVAMIANGNGVPIICGEEGMVEKGGLATYGINYYNLGKQTAAQAVKILKGEAEPAAMPIEYLEDVTLKINEEVATELGISIPDDLKQEMNQ